MKIPHPRSKALPHTPCSRCFSNQRTQAPRPPMARCGKLPASYTLRHVVATQFSMTRTDQALELQGRTW